MSEDDDFEEDSFDTNDTNIRHCKSSESLILNLQLLEKYGRIYQY